MGREIIRGETVPLDTFPVELKARARRVAERALSLALPVPDDIEIILTAADADLRAVQLTENKKSFTDLDEWELNEQEKLGLGYGLSLAGRKTV